MFGLLRRLRPADVRPHARIRLRLEGMESREQPDGMMLPPLPPPPTPPNPSANVAPVIVDFEAEEIGNGMFLITGRVIDEMPGAMIVTLGGSTSASGTMIVTLSDGTFSKVVTLQTDGTDVGVITARTTDAFGLMSAEVEVDVNPTPP